MQVEIKPGTACGTVQAPPSKSMAHRYLIAAALVQGKSVISGVEFSQDILATIDCLRALGVDVSCEGDCVTVSGTASLKPREDLLCRESGSTLRFMLPLCLLSGEKAVLKGSARLMERPLNVYETLCAENGFSLARKEGCIEACGCLRAGEYTLDASVSSQFITGLIFALLCCGGESKIILKGKIESRSYIDLTLSSLKSFGFSVGWKGEDQLILSAQGGAPRNLAVEGDYSNAAFLDALNLLGGRVEVSGLKEDSLQGDRVYIDYFKELQNGTPTLSLADCPDLGPILMAMAAAFHGARFIDTARLKIKESDRGAAMAEELKKCGVRVDLFENEILVHGGTLSAPNSPLCGHNDHRIVMAAAVAAALCDGPVEIRGAEAVARSYPEFFEDYGMLGGEVRKE